MANDLAQQIRDRLDALAALPAAFLEVPGTVAPEEIEKWQRAWEEALAGQPRVHILAAPVRCEPTGDLMRAGLLAVVDRHQPAPVATYLGETPPLFCIDCSHGRYDEVPWPCPELRVIAKGLGIEVADG